MEKPRLKDFFQVSATRGGGDHSVRKVLTLESSGKKLGDWAKAISDRQHFGFLVQVSMYSRVIRL